MQAETVDSSAFDLARFVADCKAAAGDLRRIADLVRTAISDPKTLRGQLGDRLGDFVLYEDATLTVLHVRVPAGYRTPAHDHSMWAVVGVYDGQEDNRMYDLEASGPVQREMHEVRAPGVLTMQEGVIHAIANPLARVSSALHVYGGHLASVDRNLWDPQTGERMRFTREDATRLARGLRGQV